MSEANGRALTDSRLGKKSSPIMMASVIEPRLSGPNGELRMFDAFMKVDLAHVAMLTECGIVPHEKARRLLGALLDLQARGPDAIQLDPSLGTLLLQIERHLAREAGQDAAGMLQLARSRIDQGATIMRVLVRDRLLDAVSQLMALQDALRDRARAWQSVVMPGYTHGQHSQPWVLGHYLLAQFDAFVRDVDRLLQNYARVNRSPLGAAAMSGTGWPIDRRRAAALLGFDDIIRNSKDASFINGMDFLPETAANLSILLNGCGRLASDLYVWSTWEFGLVDLDAGLCGTSSIMPQKKNPYVLERVRALAGESIGWVATQLGLMRSSTSTDCDLNFASNHYLGYFDSARWSLDLMAEAIRTLNIDQERMAERAGAHWTTSSNLADCMVRETGLDFRQAHHVVGALVRAAIESGLHPRDVRSADVDRVSQAVLGRPLQLGDDAVRQALDVQAFVDSRVSEGSIRPAEVASLLEEADRCAQRLRAQWEAHRRAVDGASDTLALTAARLAGR